MKLFETPIAEIQLFSVEDILTASGGGTPDEPTEPTSKFNDAIGVALDGGVCNGTQADFWEDDCPARLE